MSELPAPARSVTLSVTIDRPAGDVHAFLSDAANWPRWAVVNVLDAEPGHEPGWWRIATAQGPGEIRIRAEAATGVLDHDSATRTSRDGWQRCRRVWLRTAAVLTS